MKVVDYGQAHGSLRETIRSIRVLANEIEVGELASDDPKLEEMSVQYAKENRHRLLAIEGAVNIAVEHLNRNLAKAGRG